MTEPSIAEKLCRRCEVALPLADFGARANGKLRSWCKSCNRAETARYRASGPKIKEVFPEGLKRCKQCSQIKSFAEFANNKKWADGKYCWCVECVTAKRKRYKASAILRYDGNSAHLNKACSHCKTEKPWTAFSFVRHSKAKLHAWCKDCMNQSGRERNKTPEARVKRKAFQRAYEKTPSGRRYRRKKHLKQKYGISPDAYELLFTRQNGLCAICSDSPNGRRLSVDHNHGTGDVRGLLCGKCNSAIGMLGDTAEGVMRAVEYLERVG